MGGTLLVDGECFSGADTAIRNTVQEVILADLNL